MRFRNIIFDLDGTLIDSIPGITGSLRRAVACVIPGRSVPELEPWIGPPLRVMLARIWPDLEPVLLDKLVAAFRVDYDAVGCLESRPYSGASELLVEAAASGFSIHVLTNKPDLPTRRILAHFGWDRHLADTHSPDTPGHGFKTKAEGAAALAREWKLDPELTWLVGDSPEDAEAAHACGFSFAAAVYGYGWGSSAAADIPGTRMENLFQLGKLLLKQGEVQI